MAYWSLDREGKISLNDINLSNAKSGIFNWTKKSKIWIGYGFVSLAKTIGQNLNSKYGKMLIDSTKKETNIKIKAVIPLIFNF